MKRTSIAAAIAALFLATASNVYAQPATSGTGASAAGATGGTGTAATSGTSNTARSAATAKGGDTRTSSDKLARGDRKFLETAAQDGLKEVEVGRAAAGKASDPAVKAFADRMVKDHADANKKLMDVATSKGLTPPTDLRRSDRRAVDKMAKMDTAKFDREYMKDMVKDHRKDVKAFEKEARDAKDPDVKRFASETLPVLQEHLRMAEDTDNKLRGAGSAATRSTAKGGAASSSATGTSAPSSTPPSAGTSASGTGSTSTGTSAGTAGTMGKDTGAKK